MNEIWELFIESLGTLTLNKMRTGLAILGIVIGIGSVIALVSLGEATQRSIEASIQSLGANLLTVSPNFSRQGLVQGSSAVNTLTNADAQAIANSPSVNTISAVSPEIDSRAQISVAGNNSNLRINGVTEAYAQVHKVEIQEGRFISSTDNLGLRKVVVLGPSAAEDLFASGSDPVGQAVRIKNISFEVIGVTVSKGGSGFANQDNMAYIPLLTAQQLVFGQQYLSNISLEAKSPNVMTDAQNQVGYLLLSRHKLSDPTQADFMILSQADILNAASTTTGIFTALLSGIAAISLLVGGIGIMNIMLVTVNERTREIGLRKALGAKRKIITMQFLTESIILTFTGGIIGIILGIIFSYAFSIFTNTLFVVSPRSVLIAFAVSAGIGIIFGWYPASRAAKLQPIEALRYE